MQAIGTARPRLARRSRGSCWRRRAGHAPADCLQLIDQSRQHLPIQTRNENRSIFNADVAGSELGPDEVLPSALPTGGLRPCYIQYVNYETRPLPAFVVTGIIVNLMMIVTIIVKMRRYV